MTPVPDLDGASAVFGNIKHMPKFATLPEEFQRERHPACKFVETWFYRGVKVEDFPAARKGVDAIKARRAIGAVLRSFEPKHEHKIAGAGFLANEWFDFDKKGEAK